jgi:hypothetical protein
MSELFVIFFLMNRPLASLARQTQTFYRRDLRRQKDQSLRNSINAFA